VLTLDDQPGAIELVGCARGDLGDEVTDIFGVGGLALAPPNPRLDNKYDFMDAAGGSTVPSRS